MLFVSLLKVIQQRPEDGASLTPATTKTGGISSTKSTRAYTMKLV